MKFAYMGKLCHMGLFPLTVCGNAAAPDQMGSERETKYLVATSLKRHMETEL